MSKPLLFDGMGKAFVGSATQAGMNQLAVYDSGRMIQILTRRDGMEWDEAVEFLEFNTVSAWVGNGTPLVLRRMSLRAFNEELEDIK